MKEQRCLPKIPSFPRLQEAKKVEWEVLQDELPPIPCLPNLSAEVLQAQATGLVGVVLDLVEEVSFFLVVAVSFRQLLG